MRWTIKKLDKNGNSTDAGDDQSTFILMVLKESKKQA